MTSFPSSPTICSYAISVSHQYDHNCSTYSALLTAFLERTVLPAHPAAHAPPLEVAQASLLSHDVRVHSTDFFTEAVEMVRLLLEVLVLGVHLAELAFRGLGVGEDGLAAALELVKVLLSRADGLHLLADRALVIGKRGKRGGEVQE